MPKGRIGPPYIFLGRVRTGSNEESEVRTVCGWDAAA